MANQDQVKTLVTAIDQALEFFNRNLVTRPDWGKITFEKADPDLKRARSLLDYLKILPLEYLTDEALNNIVQRINQLTPVLRSIDTFTIETNAAPQRDGFISTIHTQVDAFYSTASQWVPFLAYQKGDVAANVGKLSSAVEESRALIAAAKKDIEEKHKEVDAIVAAARTASVSAGAAVFTEDFLKEARDQENLAKNWLIATGIVGVIGIGAACTMWYFAYNSTNLGTPQLVQVITAKLVILSILIGASTWCGGIYKALRHQTSVNKHRALSLRTLQAFAKAASDDQTKNAVLMEACRAVFVGGSTGYLDGKGGADESSLKIIEIAKTLSGKA